MYIIYIKYWKKWGGNTTRRPGKLHDNSILLPTRLSRKGHGKLELLLLGLSCSATSRGGIFLYFPPSIYV
jgi:hypothetical protein